MEMEVTPRKRAWRDQNAAKQSGETNLSLGAMRVVRGEVGLGKIGTQNGTLQGLKNLRSPGG